jgi:hypothetical protein
VSSTARLRPAAAILGKTVKKRAVSVAAGTSACCDNGRYNQSTDLKICRRYCVRPRLKAWQGCASRQSPKIRFVAAPILLERIIGGALLGGLHLGKTLEERSRRCVTLAFKAFGRGPRKWVTSW